jgi:hypothetical protein
MPHLFSVAQGHIPQKNKLKYYLIIFHFIFYLYLLSGPTLLILSDGFIFYGGKYPTFKNLHNIYKCLLVEHRFSIFFKK